MFWFQNFWNSNREDILLGLIVHHSLWPYVMHLPAEVHQIDKGSEVFGSVGDKVGCRV